MIEIIKLIVKSVIFSIIILEIILQICVYFNLSFIKNSMLLYNPYCDQEYWTIRNNKFNSVSKDYITHPLLTFVNNNSRVPITIDSEIPLSDSNVDLVVYGSSFTGHKIFKDQINSIYKNSNYAVPSYGLDQIYLSYQLTKNRYPNKTVLIGFLLEDLDRSIFYKRDYEKVAFQKNNNDFELTNVPVDPYKERQVNDIYSMSLIKNIFYLSKNKFIPKNSKCHYSFKKELLHYMFDEIIFDAEELNQNLIFVSFNFIEDFIYQDSVNWREKLYDDYFNSKKVKYIKSKEIFNTKALESSVNNFYSKEDMHLNNEGFRVVIDNLNSNISEGQGNLYQ